MSTAFHASTYIQMGDDFDSRNRFLKNPANGIFEGAIVAGQSWSANIVSDLLAIRFVMGSYVFTVRASDANSGVYVNPTGVSIGVASE